MSPEVILNIIVSISDGGEVHVAGGEVSLVWELLHPAIQVIEDIDIVIHHQPVISQEASPVRFSGLDIKTVIYKAARIS